MPLTVRQDGNTAANIIHAQWFNDYYNLLTGAMTDQEVTIAQNVIFKAIGGPPAAPTLAAVAGNGLGVGAYQYAVTFETQDGSSALGTAASVTTTTGSQEVSITAIPIGPAGTVLRRLWRTTVGGSTFYQLATLNDNVTTTYTDTTSDTTLTANGAFSKKTAFGGALFIKDSQGNQKAAVYNDGSISFDAGNFWSDGYGNIHANQGNFTSFVSESKLSSDGAKFTSDGNGNVTANKLTITGTGGLFPGISLPLNTGVWLGEVTNDTGYTGIQSDSSGNIGIWLSNGGFFQIATVGHTNPTASSKTLFEVTNAGNLIVSGTTIKSSSSTTPSLGNSASFDSFDLAESYPCDADYEPGTVVCIDETKGVFTKCTHEYCACAMVVTNERAGFIAGLVDHEKGYLPIALAGRVRVRASQPVKPRQLVVPDGQGGVRPKSPDEFGGSIGFAIEASHNGKVGIVLGHL